LGLCLLFVLPELCPLLIKLEEESQAHRAQADGWPKCPGTSDGQGDLSRSIPYPAGRCGRNDPEMASIRLYSWKIRARLRSMLPEENSIERSQ
jgi:hypothetical protein